MRTAFQQIGEFTPDKLIAGNYHPIDVKAVELAAGTGVLKRGTLININGAICSAKTDIPIGILCDDTELGEEAINAVIYICGDFKASEIIVGTNTTSKAKTVDDTTDDETTEAAQLTVKDFELELQKLGIFLK